MNAKSIKGHNIQDIASELEESMTDGFTPTLAIVFMSIKQDRKAVLDLFTKKGIEIYGATSAGEFIDGDISEESTVAMLIDLNKDYFKVLFAEAENNSTREAARRLGEEGLRRFAKPAFIVSGSGLQADGEMIVRGIEDVIGASVNIFGGMAADDFTMTGTYVFTNSRESDNGIVAIVVDEEKIKLRGLASCGWQPVGTVRTITRSEGCVVYTIDNEPALDIIMKYMGIPPENIDRHNDVVINIGANFPMQLQREDDATPIMRTAMLGNKDDHSLICGGSVPQGSKVRFSLPADFSVINQVVDECRKIKNHQQEADALVVFSCKARHVAFGPLVKKEISGIKDVWKVPMVGFFTYGEMGRALKGNQEFHNTTCCWVAIKEVQ